MEEVRMVVHELISIEIVEPEEDDRIAIVGITSAGSLSGISVPLHCIEQLLGALLALRPDPEPLSAASGALHDLQEEGSPDSVCLLPSASGPPIRVHLRERQARAWRDVLTAHIHRLASAGQH